MDAIKKAIQETEAALETVRRLKDEATIDGRAAAVAATHIENGLKWLKVMELEAK